jgi:hypothetical protein
MVATPAADPDILAIGGASGAIERSMDIGGDKVECRAATHHDRIASVSRQHEHRHMDWRIVAPPAFPALVGPRPAHGAEHVAAHDPCADIHVGTGGEVVINTGLAAIETMHPAP